MKAGLSEALDNTPIHFCAVDEDGESIAAELNSVRAHFDGKIVIVPTSPFAEDMQKRLIPSVLSECANDPGQILLARDAGVDPSMLRAAQARVQHALEAASDPLELQDTLLLVIGHGSIDTDANSNLMKMSRMVWEGLGFGWAEVTYVNGAFPSIEQTLDRAGRMGFKNIVVLPYVIIGDHTIDGIPDRIAAVVDDTESTKVIYAERLGAEDNVVRTLVERVREAIAGNAKSVMNCQLCTYREQVLAIEAHDHHDHSHGHDHNHDD